LMRPIKASRRHGNHIVVSAALPPPRCRLTRRATAASPPPRYPPCRRSAVTQSQSHCTAPATLPDYPYHPSFSSPSYSSPTNHAHSFG
jgi:hypothetical protein